jgi:hypothetical protein
MSKAFHLTLDQLERYQTRPAEGQRDVSELAATQKKGTATPTPAETSVMEELATLSGIAAPHYPSKESIAACSSNPDAMAAIKAGDAWAFARAMGVEHPSEEFLELARQPGTVFEVARQKNAKAKHTNGAAHHTNGATPPNGRAND